MESDAFSRSTFSSFMSASFMSASSLVGRSIHVLLLLLPAQSIHPSLLLPCFHEKKRSTPTVSPASQKQRPLPFAEFSPATPLMYVFRDVNPRRGGNLIRARARIPTTRSCCWLRGGAATPYDRRKWEQQQTLGPLRLRERRRTAPTSGWNGRRQRRRPARRCTADVCVPTRARPRSLSRQQLSRSLLRPPRPHGTLDFASRPEILGSRRPRPCPRARTYVP
jgi:hypothetical protein